MAYRLAVIVCALVVCVIAIGGAGESPPASTQTGPSTQTAQTKPASHLLMSMDSLRGHVAVTCKGDAGRLLCSVDKSKFDLKLPAEAVKELRKAAKVFCDDPPPFLDITDRSMGGSPLDWSRTSTRVALDDRIYVSVFDTGHGHKETYALAQAILRAAKQAGINEDQRRVIRKAMSWLDLDKHRLAPGESPVMTGVVLRRTGEALIVPNGSPMSLAKAVLEPAPADVKRLDARAFVRGISYLTDLHDPAAGAYVFKRYKERPKEDSALNAWILYASLRLGCTEGLAYARAAIKRNGPMGLGGYQLRSLLMDLLSEDTLNHICRQAGVADMTSANAPRVLAYIIKHRKSLYMSPGLERQRRYVLWRPGATGPGQTTRPVEIGLPKVKEKPAAIARKLSHKIASFEVTQMPLRNVLQMLGMIAGVKIDADWDALAKVGVEPGKPITLTLKDESFSSILRNILTQAGKGQKLRYKITDAGVTVAPTPDPD